MTAPPRLDLKEWSRRQDERFGAETLEQISEMLSQTNEILDAIAPPISTYYDETMYARVRKWLGEKFINLGVRLMGDDAPHME